MSHQSQPVQALDRNRKMYGRETEKTGSLPRLGREHERRRQRRSNKIRRPSGAGAHPPSHPTPGRTLGQECGAATRPPPNPRLALPSPFALHRGRRAREAANAARKKAKRQEGRLAPTLGTPRRGGNSRIEVGRAARDARRGLKIRPSGELLRLIPIGATRQACGRGALWSALASCCIGIRLSGTMMILNLLDANNFSTMLV